MNLTAAQQMTDSRQSHPDKPPNAAEASSAQEASPSPPLGRNSGTQAKRGPCCSRVIKSNVWLARIACPCYHTWHLRVWSCKGVSCSICSTYASVCMRHGGSGHLLIVIFACQRLWQWLRHEWIEILCCQEADQSLQCARLPCMAWMRVSVINVAFLASMPHARYMLTSDW